MRLDEPILVAGAGGFIGGHLVRELYLQGHTDITAVDIKPIEDWHQVTVDADSQPNRDLSRLKVARSVTKGKEVVFNLACDMGGMGFIEMNKALCSLNILINTHLLMGAHRADVQRYFYSSSACVYRQDLQDGTIHRPLRETDAYPADPEDGYGWEKLTSERMCRHFNEDFGLQTRVARFHTIYGPEGTWDGGREKVPAALCRKVALAKLTGETQIEVWGDGTQVRSLLYIDDLIAGVLSLTESNFAGPVNIGATETTTVEGLLCMVEEIAGIDPLHRVYDLSKPQGVRERNSDNTVMQGTTGWEPSTSLQEGMERTYAWVFDQVKASL